MRSSLAAAALAAMTASASRTCLGVVVGVSYSILHSSAAPFGLTQARAAVTVTLQHSN